MKKFVKKFVKISLIFIGLFIIIGYSLKYQFDKDNSDKFIWLRNIKKTNFDYAFIGSSRTLNMVDINLIDSIYGTNGINIGMGGSDFRTLYMILYTFLDIQENNINDLYIQVDPFMLYKDSIYNKPNYDYYFYSFINDKNINSCFPKNNNALIYKYFPIIKYIEFNKVYNLTHFIRSFNSSSVWDESKGSSLIYNHLPFKPVNNQIDKHHKKHLVLNFEDKELLSKIIGLCRNFNIQPTFYSAPIFNYQISYKPSYPKFEDEINILSDSLDIKYLNFMEYNNNNESFFKDMIHTNVKGSIELTKAIIKALKHNNVYKEQAGDL